MIEVTGLQKNYGALRVLRGIDLQIGAGTVTGVAGPNGSGKTTLIKILLGLVLPDGGSVHVRGESIDGAWRYRERIGYMPQMPRFPDNLTGRELLRMMQDLRVSTEREIDDELIGVLQLGNELHKPLRALSGGTRQKVSAVIAFLFSPEILVLDEPTAGLDPLASSQLKDRIQQAAGNGTTVLFASHVMSEMEEMSDTVVFLLDGRVQFAEPPDATRARTGQPNLERAVAHLLSASAGEKVAS